MLETARLLLRPLEATDVAGMFALDSDPDVHKYIGGIGSMVSDAAQSAAVIAYIQAQYHANGIGRWAVLHRATGEFMGWAGLKLIADETNSRRNFYDLGYRFRPKYWGQGYGYEAAQAWLDYSFEVMQLPEICGQADMDNLASCRILEKVGLRRINEFDKDSARYAWFEQSRADWLGR